jgi:hypothetical protein
MSMERRIYFAFPAPRQARGAVSELLAAGISRTDIHAVAFDPQAVSDLPPASPEQRRDRTWSLETTYWRANLALYFFALVGLLVALYAGKPILALLALGIMVLTFVTGERFAVRVPHAHLDEQSVPLHHGEVVLMVDVPASRVHDVEQVVSRRHPEVGVGGVGWHIHGLNA